MTDMQELAQRFRAAFEQANRDDGSSYWRHIASTDLGDTAASDMACDAHAGHLLDDTRYEYIVAALDILSETDDEDDQRDRVDMDVDVYNTHLAAWLGSSLLRAQYVDDAVSEFGWDAERGIYGALAMGQYMERIEVLDLVRSWLADYAESEDANDDE